MRCPYCRHQETKVIDSRETNEGKIIRRRRECDECKNRFSTHEELEILNLIVKKRDGHREPYSQEKIISGISKACEKRPVSQANILRLVSLVEQDLYNTGRSEVESKNIGNLVINHLKNLDEVAYLRFASVYKNFQNASGFKKEIENLKK